MSVVRHLMLGEARTCTREEFRKDAPALSIALDGVIPEGPWIDLVRLQANFNHHEGVNRLATRCTAAQIDITLRMGGLSAFFNGLRPVNVFYNDCDPDVILSLWILENRLRVQSMWGGPFDELLRAIDLLDTTAATYPFPPSMDLSAIQWVFEPYFEARDHLVLDRENPVDYEDVIQKCFIRIERFLDGTPGRVQIKTDFKIVGQYNGWGMFQCVGSLSRIGIVSSGYPAFVLVHKRPDGRYVYTLQRTCDGVVFPLELFYEALNAVETAPGKWGGCDTVGGSPREHGSDLSPERVAEIINIVLAAHVSSAMLGIV